MSFGTILAYKRKHSGRNGFLAIVRQFGEAGITLTNPGNSAVFLRDIFGEEVLSSQEELERIFDRSVGNDYVYQWWLDERTSLLAQVRWAGYYEYLEFYPDGLLAEEVALVERAIVGLIDVLPDLIAVVVDLRGRCEDVDFGDVFSRPDRLPEVRPDRIYVPENEASSLYTFRNLEPVKIQPGLRIYSAESAYRKS
ncbi:hypothetical protein AB0I28_14355 [Phytomonospora sp. NPDC050363]|uniref:hypothetical protein n=1 Tax=Phytomonospora sp. NPDC050363 TaxID=3155642 RepID=UPI00340D3764